MVAQLSIKMLFAAVATKCLTANADAFLKQDPTRLLSAVDHDAQFEEAMEAVMGCRSPFAMDSAVDIVEEEKHLVAVEGMLKPLWNVLPKQLNGRAEWKSIRYMMHRYFRQQYGFLIRGMETAHHANDTDHRIDVMHAHASSVAGSMLQVKDLAVGFTLRDASYTVATLEKLLSNSEITNLQKAYEWMDMTPKQRISKTGLRKLLKAYAAMAILGEDLEHVAFSDEALEDIVPGWKSISKFVKGLADAIEYSHSKVARSGSGAVAMTQRFSFDDAHRAVSELTKSFGSFWQDQCHDLEDQLKEFDYSGTGRIKLSDFYGANKDGETRFGESEVYLREMGALDETSSWKGKQLIISNYIQGASNCIMTKEHFFVCCSNPCESILGDLEEAVGSPLARPDTILSVIANMTNFDEKSPQVSAALKGQLMRIGETYDGQVPLHGRLFAQWLHYVFPYECPFPHKSSRQTVVPMGAFEGAEATAEEIDIQAAQRNESMHQAHEIHDAQTLSQWEDDEELIADYSHLRESRRSPLGIVGKIAGLITLLIALFQAFGTPSKLGTHTVAGLEFDQKTHIL